MCIHLRPPNILIIVGIRNNVPNDGLCAMLVPSTSITVYSHKWNLWFFVIILYPSICHSDLHVYFMEDNEKLFAVTATKCHRKCGELCSSWFFLPCRRRRRPSSLPHSSFTKDRILCRIRLHSFSVCVLSFCGWVTATAAAAMAAVAAAAADDDSFLFVSVNRFDKLTKNGWERKKFAKNKK